MARILLADDDAEERQRLATILWAYDHKVTIVANGQAARRTLRMEAPFDLILTDGKMGDVPEQNGPSLVNFVRTQLGKVPILAASADPDMFRSVSNAEGLKVIPKIQNGRLFRWDEDAVLAHLKELGIPTEPLPARKAAKSAPKKNPASKKAPKKTPGKSNKKLPPARI